MCTVATRCLPSTLSPLRTSTPLLLRILSFTSKWNATSMPGRFITWGRRLVQINWRKTFLFMYRYHMDKSISDIQYKNIHGKIAPPASSPVSCRYTRQMFMSPLPYYTRGTRSYFCGLSFLVPHVGNCHAQPGTCHQSPVRFFRLPTSLLSSALLTRPSLLPSEDIRLAYVFAIWNSRNRTTWDHVSTHPASLYIQQLTSTFGHGYSMATTSGQTEAMLQQYGYPTLFSLRQNRIIVHLPTAAP